MPDETEKLKKELRDCVSEMKHWTMKLNSVRYYTEKTNKDLEHLREIVKKIAEKLEVKVEA